MILHFFIEIIFSLICLCPLKEGPQLMQFDCPMIEIKTFFDSYSWWDETDWWKFDAIPSKQILKHETSSKQNTLFFVCKPSTLKYIEKFSPNISTLVFG